MGTKQSQPVVQNSIQTTPIPSPTSIDETVYTEATRSANWKTYRNEEYGFEFRYPPSFGEVEKNGLIYFSFSNNPSLSLELNGGHRTRLKNPDGTEYENCGLLKNSFLYCRYLNSSGAGRIFITEASLKDEPFTLVAETAMLPRGAEPRNLPALDFRLNLPELDEIDYETRIKLTRDDLPTATQHKIDEFDQILSTFQFVD